LIIVQDVVKSYGDGTPALDHVSLQINDRDFVFLVGSSGAGKTTLIRLINKDEEPTSGSIFVDGVNITRLKRGEVPSLRRKIGVIFQDFKLLPHATVFENVEFALRIVGEHDGRGRQRVEEAIETVGLSAQARRRPYQLSGGEQQRVAIARCLVTDPPIVIADEPTGNLDPDTGWETMNLLVRINAMGTTVLIATHNRELVNTMRRRVISLADGKVVRDEVGGGYSG
jgi:cell division transport system ATP-binding protein